MPRAGVVTIRLVHGRLRLVPAFAFALVGCDGGSAPPAPPPGPGPGTAAAAEPAPPPSGPAAPRLPLPAAPRDGADRIAGLLHLLAWGDTALVEFAQRTLSAFPDEAAAAGALAEAGERNLRANPALVQNILGCVKHEALGRRLADFLRRCIAEGDPQVRRMAVAQWAESQEDPDREFLAGLVADSWGPVSQAALFGLRCHPGAASAAALRGVLSPARGGDRLPLFTRASACAALGWLGDPGSIPFLRDAMEAARATGEAEFPVLLGAAQGLGRLGDAEGLSVLRGFVLALPLDRPAVPPDSDPSSSDGPEAVLAGAKDGALRDRLVRQAIQAAPAASAAAVRLLREYPAGPEALAAFRAAAERADWEPALEGLDALRAAGDPGALASTLAALVAPATDRRYAAALALGRFRDPASVKPLCGRLAAEPDSGVARKICDALGLVGDAAAAPALLAFLRSETAPSPEQALRAFEARSNLRGPLAAAAAAVLAALVESDATPRAVRFHAARALGQAPRGGGPRTALAALLRSPVPSLRTAAADALGDLGDPGARDALCQAYAREPDDGVAGAVRDAILRMDLRNP